MSRRDPSIKRPVPADHWIVLTQALLILLVPALTPAAEVDRSYRYEDANIALRMIPRTPDQMAAFYEARGFPTQAITEIRKACFITVGITNRRRDILWLELANWRIADETGKPVQRLHRDYWNALWKRLDLPLANRATFGWTQLPESRDLHPDEPAGGNLGVLPPSGRFMLEARFRTGADGRGEPLTVRIFDIECPQGPPLEHSK